jgi:hypothetical protein
MLAGMERSRATALWTVTWFVDDLGYQVILMNRCRVTKRFESEGLDPDSRERVREEARERAVEMALEYRVPLFEVREATYRHVPDRR